MENKIKIIITEDNSTIRDGLALLINATDGMECIAAFSSCEDMLEGINKFNPDIFLQDIELPGMSGIEGVKKVKEKIP
ncbi:MAG: response regulator, partial [Calditrichaeota bacterium]|nr:response regulator [Calditrichota bacterium]